MLHILDALGCWKKFAYARANRSMPPSSLLENTSNRGCVSEESEDSSDNSSAPVEISNGIDVELEYDGGSQTVKCAAVRLCSCRK